MICYIITGICLILIIIIYYNYLPNRIVRGIGSRNSIIFIPEISENLNCLESLRVAGAIHKNIRSDMHRMLKPGLDIVDLSDFINSRTRYYTNNIGKNGGIGFPPVLSKSHIIAHYSPYKKSILGYNDNLTIDFGVHVNGWIIDSAFTVHFNPELDILSKATKEAIDNAIKIVGIDTPIDDISSTINEIVESYEMMYRGKLHQLKVIVGLTGHNIKQYNIHGGVSIPNKPSNTNERIKAGVYAIEPFVSILDSKCYKGTEKNNYRIKPSYISECSLLYEHFNNLIFSDTHLKYYDINNINHYIKKNMIDIYPAIYGHRDDMSCQYEHTIYLDENIKENVSKSYDY
jgi:methionyl aminopeptidase